MHGLRTGLQVNRTHIDLVTPVTTVSIATAVVAPIVVGDPVTSYTGVESPSLTLSNILMTMTMMMTSLWKPRDAGDIPADDVIVVTHAQESGTANLYQKLE